MQYDLVFEGGGAKGMVFVGAMQEFEVQTHTFDRVLGTSAGAITATLLAAGYDATEMLAVLQERENGRSVFANFLETPATFTHKEINDSLTSTFLRSIDLPVVPEFLEEVLDERIIAALMAQPNYRHLFSFVERGGWFAADRFLAWMQEKLDSGTYQGAPRRFSAMNLAEFYATTGVELSVIASDTTDGRLLVLNHRTAPDCPIAWAVRMSMSIPLLWQEVQWRADWGTYRGQAVAGHLIVDGGLLSNFPIELFVSQQPYVTDVMGLKRSDNVLGFLIDETKPVDGAPERPATKTPFDFTQWRTAQRIQRLIDTMTQAHDKMVFEALKEMVVRLPAEGYSTTEFDMSDARRDALIAAGRHTTQAFLAARPTRRVLSPQEAEAMQRTADQVAARVLER